MIARSILSVRPSSFGPVLVLRGTWATFAAALAGVTVPPPTRLP